MKNVFKKAHEITQKIIRKGDSYRETFRLALIFVYSEMKKGVNKMVELRGSEKQVKWASDIRERLVSTMSEAINILEKYQAETFEKRGKRVPRRDRFISEMKNEIEIINSIESAKQMIECYKNIFNSDVNEFLNQSINEIKNA